MVRVNCDLRYSSRSLLKNLISDSFSVTVSFKLAHYFSNFAILSCIFINQNRDFTIKNSSDYVYFAYISLAIS